MPATAVTPTAKPLSLGDERMLQLMDEVVGGIVRGIRTNKAFLEAIGLHERSLSGIRHGKWSFRVPHYLAAAKLFGVSVDWLFGLTDDPRPHYTRLGKAKAMTALRVLLSEVK